MDIGALLDDVTTVRAAGNWVIHFMTSFHHSGRSRRVSLTTTPLDCIAIIPVTETQTDGVSTAHSPCVFFTTADAYLNGLNGSRRRDRVSVIWSLFELQMYVQYVPARIPWTPLPFFCFLDSLDPLTFRYAYTP